MINRNIRFVLFILSVWIISQTAYLAHGFGERYDLPIPLYLYIIGGGLTVMISIFFISFMLKKVDSSFEYSKINLSTYFSTKISFIFVSLVRLLSILVFMTVTLLHRFLLLHLNFSSSFYRFYNRQQLLLTDCHHFPS